jgi:ethanolamine ammonia-lyase large subunit
MGTWTTVAGGERHRSNGPLKLLAAASPRRSGEELADAVRGREAGAR